MSGKLFLLGGDFNAVVGKRAPDEDPTIIGNYGLGKETRGAHGFWLGLILKTLYLQTRVLRNLFGSSGLTEEMVKDIRSGLLIISW